MTTCITTVLRAQMQLPVADSTHMAVYVSRPTTQGRYPVVVLGMELFGLTEHLQAEADRVAQWGYVVVAPNFYHRQWPQGALSMDDAGRTRGFELLQQMTREHLLDDVRAIIAWSAQQAYCRSEIGFLGFSLGGHIGFYIATQLPIRACVCCYAGWLTNTDISLSQPEPPIEFAQGIADQGGELLLLVGDQDHLIHADQLEILRTKLQAAKVLHELVVYAGVKHRYLYEAGPSYDVNASADTWQRIKTLFARTLSVAQS